MLLSLFSFIYYYCDRIIDCKQIAYKSSTYKEGIIMMTNITELYNRMVKTVKDDEETISKITKVIPKVVSAYYTFVGNVTEELNSRVKPKPFYTKVSIEHCKKEFIETVIDILENLFSTSKDRILFNSAIVLAKPYIDVFLDLEISTIEAISNGEYQCIASDMFEYTSGKLSETLNEMLEAAMNFEDATAEDRFVKAVCDDYTKDLDIVEDMINDAKEEYESLSEKLHSEPAGDREHDPKVTPIEDQLKMSKKYLDSLQEKRDDIMTNRHEFLKNHGKIKE
jgi:hypothetical protein